VLTNNITLILNYSSEVTAKEAMMTIMTTMMMMTMLIYT